MIQASNKIGAEPYNPLAWHPPYVHSHHSREIDPHFSKSASLPFEAPQTELSQHSMRGIPKDYAYFDLTESAAPAESIDAESLAMTSTAASVAAATEVTTGLSQTDYQRALDYSKLASQAYDAEDNFVAETGLWAVFGGLPDGLIAQDFSTPEYTAVDKFNLMDGYLSLDATLFKKTGPEGDEYVLAFRGTEPTSIFDWGEDIAQFYGSSEQYDNALELAQRLHEQYGDKLSFTGHSLGGGLAQVAALSTGLDAICFDAAGLSQATISKYGLDLNNAAHIKHVNVQGDWISDHNEQMDDTTLNTPPYKDLPHATLPECKQYGEQFWLEKVEPSTVRLPFQTLRNMATAVLNHAWHTVVYQLENQNFVTT